GAAADGGRPGPRVPQAPAGQRLRGHPVHRGRGGGDRRPADPRPAGQRARQAAHRRVHLERGDLPRDLPVHLEGQPGDQREADDPGEDPRREELTSSPVQTRAVDRERRGPVKLRVHRRRMAAYLPFALAALAAAALPVGRAAAGVTARWSVDGYEQWDEGEAEEAFITSIGEVRPGWQTARTDLEAGGVWSAVRGADGTVGLGTGDKGAVWRVRGGKG